MEWILILSLGFNVFLYNANQELHQKSFNEFANTCLKEVEICELRNEVLFKSEDIKELKKKLENRDYIPKGLNGKIKKWNIPNEKENPFIKDAIEAAKEM
jgi:hypothetical protein